MSTFTHLVVAGDGDTLHFDRQLSELAALVGIPPPIFQGRLVYQEYGVERWLIKTTIPACTNDPSTQEVIYEERYPDWEVSVQLAMQGAIARICGAYQRFIPPGSLYRNFGRRQMDGTPYYYPGNGSLSGYRRYLMDRECNTVDLEDMMKKEMGVLDQAVGAFEEANERIAECEKANVYVDGKRNELQEANKELMETNKKLEERLARLEEPQKLEEELIEIKVFDGILIKTLELAMERRDLLFQENVELRKKLEESQAAQKDQGVKGATSKPLESDPCDGPSHHTRSRTRLGARTRKGVFKK